MATCPSILAARCAFCLCFVRYVFVVRGFFVGEPKQNQGRRLVDGKLVQAPSNYIVGRPKAALLFRFYSDFRCGVLLFIVLLVMYEYRNS